jgi:hypothetical protein
MKLFFLSAFTLFTLGAQAQTKLMKQAIISTTTDVVAPDEEDVSQIQQNTGGGGGQNFRNFMDGETKSVTFIKNDLVKTNYKSEVGRGSTYRNNTTKVTTTIMEVMGNKMGFFSSDDDMAAMGKKRDSMMQERAKTDTSMKRRMQRPEAFPITVAYTNDTKKIAGYNCKRALLITDKLIVKDTMEVWFTPDIKFENLPSTGGLSGIGNMGGAMGFEKIDGFVMQYRRNMPRGRVMEVKVTKIETDKEIADKEFDIPKDVEIKPMSEMGGPGGGGFRFQRGN